MTQRGERPDDDSTFLQIGRLRLTGPLAAYALLLPMLVLALILLGLS